MTTHDPVAEKDQLFTSETLPLTDVAVKLRLQPSAFRNKSITEHSFVPVSTRPG